MLDLMYREVAKLVILTGGMTRWIFFRQQTCHSNDSLNPDTPFGMDQLFQDCKATADGTGNRCSDRGCHCM